MVATINKLNKRQCCPEECTVKVQHARNLLHGAVSLINGLCFSKRVEVDKVKAAMVMCEENGWSVPVSFKSQLHSVMAVDFIRFRNFEDFILSLKEFREENVARLGQTTLWSYNAALVETGLQKITQEFVKDGIADGNNARVLTETRDLCSKCLAEEDLVSKAVLDDLKAMLVFCAQSDEHASAEQQIEVATKLEELSKDKHYAGILKPIFVMGTWSAMLGLVAENVNLRKARNCGGGAVSKACKLVSLMMDYSKTFDHGRVEDMWKLLLTCVTEGCGLPAGSDPDTKLKASFLTVLTHLENFAVSHSLEIAANRVLQHACLE